MVKSLLSTAASGAARDSRLDSAPTDQTSTAGSGQR
jgi:hypothetical protein